MPMLKDTDISSRALPLHVSNLCYAVDDNPLIKQLNFTIEPEGITAIMGPNGAGKSLTLRLLHGLIKPTSGSIRWGNTESKSVNKAPEQAMVFQKPVLLRRSVIENLTYALKVKNITDKTTQIQLIKQALKRSDLASKDSTPARRLSGGEQQKLAMARALMTKPAILFLDEPTSSLDPNATLAIENLVKEAASEGTKIILVTHDIGQAKRLATNILFLNNGQLEESGPTEQLLSHPKSIPAHQYFRGEIVTAS